MNLIPSEGREQKRKNKSKSISFVFDNIRRNIIRNSALAWNYWKYLHNMIDTIFSD